MIERETTRRKIAHSLRRIACWLRRSELHNPGTCDTAAAVAKYLDYVVLKLARMELEMIGDVKKALRGLEAQRDAALAAAKDAAAAQATAEQAATEAQTAQAQAEKDALALRDQIKAQEPFLMGQEDLTEVNAVLATLPPDPAPEETVDGQPPKTDNPPQ